MTLHVWLILFILSMGGSAEVLAWAVQNGQFRDLKRGNVMPLRAPGATPPPAAGRMPPPARSRLWQKLALALVFGLFGLYFIDWLVQLLHLAYA